EHEQAEKTRHVGSDENDRDEQKVAREELDRNVAAGRYQSVSGPVVVLALESDRMGAYQEMAADLRNAGVRAEVYLGGSGMRAQMKYADKRGAPIAIIQGEDERQKNVVTIKDLVLGAKLSGEISDNAEWREGQPAQFETPRDNLVAAVKETLARSYDGA
ncbi:MAG: His/Gly/Thr/Pro-type tRNA ligase C-terminal domain-containing protein, partial [Pseudomonadota bacterium]